LRACKRTAPKGKLELGDGVPERAERIARDHERVDGHRRELFVGAAADEQRALEMRDATGIWQVGGEGARGQSGKEEHG